MLQNLPHGTVSSCKNHKSELFMKIQCLLMQAWIRLKTKNCHKRIYSNMKKLAKQNKCSYTAYIPLIQNKNPCNEKIQIKMSSFITRAIRPLYLTYINSLLVFKISRMTKNYLTYKHDICSSLHYFWIFINQKGALG